MNINRLHHSDRQFLSDCGLIRYNDSWPAPSEWLERLGVENLSLILMMLEAMGLQKRFVFCGDRMRECAEFLLREEVGEEELVRMEAMIRRRMR